MEHTVSGVGVLDKSMAVLGAVADADRAVSLRALVTVTGLTKPTVHRLAVALEAHGLLRRDASGSFLLGLRVIGLGQAASSMWPLADAARPILEDLRSETGESTQLYVREGDQRVCVLSLESAHELRTIVAEGVRLPLDVGSAGRLLQSGSSPAEWTASVEERAPGVASVSAAVVVEGTVVAAVGISGPVGRLGNDPGPRFGPAVARAAARISASRCATG